MGDEATVFIVDDDPDIRAALQRVLDYAGFPVVTYSSARAFLDSYDPAQRGCLLLDIRMPQMSGLALQQQLGGRTFELPVIILTGHADVPMVIRAFKQGALEFLEKPWDNETLIGSVRRALALDYASRRRSEQLRELGKGLAALTPREKQVIELIAMGQPRKLIAAELNISQVTVETHCSHIMAKLGVDNQAQLLRLLLAEKQP
jgi:FixJ family two-component response regulator